MIDYLSLIHGIGGLSKSLSEWLTALGPVGIFGISLIDSALVPLPTGPDLSLIVLSALNPARMPLYVFLATLGSAIGSTGLYMAARQAGMRALKTVNPERRQRIEGLLGRYDLLAVIVPAILPPPFPFKLFVLSAGAFKLKAIRFMIAIVIGRTVRFLIEGILAIEFGKDADLIIRRQGPKVLAATVAILLAVFAIRFFRSRMRPAEQSAIQPE
ncbi:MAG TPA: VTT domain-containing protein [Blastocatellia bacterium]|nr:VTT domain-containing protein [Blastocatellia bacterium]